MLTHWLLVIYLLHICAGYGETHHRRQRQQQQEEEEEEEAEEGVVSAV